MALSGQRNIHCHATIIFILVECASHHVTNQDDLGALLSSCWRPAVLTGPVVDTETTVCLS